MQRPADVFWRLFATTGSVLAYLLYRRWLAWDRAPSASWAGLGIWPGVDGGK